MLKEIGIRILVAIPVVTVFYFYVENPKFNRFVKRIIRFILITLLEAVITFIAWSTFVNMLDNLRDRDGE